MTKHIKSFVLVLSMACAAIVVSLPAAAADEAKKDGVMAPSVARGKKAWTENCERCHEMRDPKDLTDREWPAVIRHMRVRAGLTGQEERDLFELFIKGNN